MLSNLIREMMTGATPEPHRRGGPAIIFDPIQGQFMEAPVLEGSTEAPAAADPAAAAERAQELQELAGGHRGGGKALALGTGRRRPRRCPRCPGLQVFRPYERPARDAPVGEWVCYDCSQIDLELPEPRA